MTPSVPKARVLFVCIGNSCRSQMAEGFARKYGGDVLIAASAGLAPAMDVSPYTIRTMDEKDIDVRDHFPKGLTQLGRAQFDLIVNMSGFDLPTTITTPEREWAVPDPIGESLETYGKIRDQIEGLVMGLILELRRDSERRGMP
ncbi:MAG: arsenate reductase ArsC [Bryobacteraceae bacterium]